MFREKPGEFECSHGYSVEIKPRTINLRLKTEEGEWTKQISPNMGGAKPRGSPLYFLNKIKVVVYHLCRCDVSSLIT